MALQTCSGYKVASLLKEIYGISRKKSNESNYKILNCHGISKVFKQMLLSKYFFYHII